MQPLSDVRVLDLTHAYAGPFATFQLAQMGAEVIKIEPPGRGDEFRAWRKSTFAQANAGKRSVSLDLKSPQGAEVLMRLLADADVLIENFRPGVAERLGLTWERVQAVNPRVIYCSVSGYGQTGELKDRPAMEWSVQAMAGVTALYIDEQADPRRLGLSSLDPFAGYMAYAAIMAALLQRHRTGTGQRVDVAMFDAAWVLNASSVADLLLGDPPVSMTLRANSARFRTQDRPLFISFIWPKWFAALCDVIGAPELLTDPRFSEDAAMQANGPALIAAVEQRLMTDTAEAWSGRLATRGVPASPVFSIPEAAEWPHVRERGLLHDVAMPDGSRVEIVGAGVGFEHDPPALQSDVPALGADTDAVLARAGYSAQDLGKLRGAGVI